MAKKRDTEPRARHSREGAAGDSAPNGSKRSAVRRLSSRSPAKGKSGSPSAGARTASARHGTNGERTLHAKASGTIALTLTSAQVRQIVHAAGGGETELSSLLDGSAMATDALALETWERRYRQELDSGSASSSLLRGLLILACFPRDGTWRSVHWVAERTGMEMSTTHRYIRTLLLLGFLEQDPKTRAYSRVTA